MKIYALLLFLLTSCQQVPVVPEPVIVKVPVAVSCHTDDITEPDWYSAHISKNADPVIKLKAVLADLNLSKGYIEELKAVIKGCS